MALGVHFTFSDCLRETQTILPLLCMGLFGAGKGPRKGGVGLVTAVVS